MTTRYGSVGLEIGRRIVEGEVRVLADADEGDVDGRALDRLADGAAHRVEITVAVERVKRRDAGAVDEVLVQHAPEAGRVIGGDADVLVEMEQLDPRPVDGRARGEAVQEAELRVPRGGDGPGVPAGLDGLGQDALGVARRGGAHLVGGWGEVDSHPAEFTMGGMKRQAIVVAVIVAGCVVASTAQQRGAVPPAAPPAVPPLPRPEDVAAPPGWKPDGHIVPPMPLTLARLPRTAITRAKYPAIDFHVHAPDLTTDAAYKELIALIDRTGMGAIVNLNGGTGAHLDAVLKAGAPYKDRVANFITFSADGINEPGWSQKFAAEMERAFKAGALGMKVLEDARPRPRRTLTARSSRPTIRASIRSGRWPRSTTSR